jgi:hypothetical protein
MPTAAEESLAALTLANRPRPPGRKEIRMAAKGLKSTWILGLSLLFSSVLPAGAQSFRTYVSGSTGNDSGPCTRALPCQTLRTAIGQTSTGGEVNVLDASEDLGLFGVRVIIDRSISIIAAGGRPAITGQLVVSPEAGGHVLLRGMGMQAAGAFDAVQVTTGAGVSLIIDDCTIQGGGNGIDFSPQGTATSNLLVRNSIISDNNLAGFPATTAAILIHPQPTAKAVVVIDNVDINNNSYGIRAFDNSNVTVRNSVVSQNLGAGIRSEQSASPPVAVSVFVEHSQVSHNGASGVVAQGSTAIVLISDVTITDNGTDVRTLSGGTVCSFHNNSIAGNPTTSSCLLN